jgi:vacuolar-type H+-ATPase subunit H
MRIIPFPVNDQSTSTEAWQLELDALEAALSGESEGSAADAWRELREDVRALAPPMAPQFAQRLGGQLEGMGTRRRTGLRMGRLRSPGRSALAGAMAFAVVIVVALVIAAPWRPGSPPRAVPQSAERTAVNANKAGAGPRAPNLPAGARAGSAVESQSAGASALLPSSTGAATAPGRVQQLAASVTLSTSPGNVQAISDGVARLTVHAEGFVQSSHVQVQQQGQSEATLMLKLPSGRLSAALAALGQLAPVRAESQSLQDITNAYDAARQRLTDATAEQRALLRALARAATAGQIDSLRERLSQARSAIAGARSALRSVSQRASSAAVEVTVLGDRRAGSEGLTLHRALHDAGRVLLVGLTVLLIAAAVLVPLALLLAALTGGGRAWRRYRRERALGPS